MSQYSLNKSAAAFNVTDCPSFDDLSSIDSESHPSPSATASGSGTWPPLMSPHQSAISLNTNDRSMLKLVISDDTISNASSRKKTPTSAPPATSDSTSQWWLHPSTSPHEESPPKELHSEGTSLRNPITSTSLSSNLFNKQPNTSNATDLEIGATPRPETSSQRSLPSSLQQSTPVSSKSKEVWNCEEQTPPLNTLNLILSKSKTHGTKDAEDSEEVGGVWWMGRVLDELEPGTMGALLGELREAAVETDLLRRLSDVMLKDLRHHLNLLQQQQTLKTQLILAQLKKREEKLQAELSQLKRHFEKNCVRQGKPAAAESAVGPSVSSGKVAVTGEVDRRPVCPCCGKLKRPPI